MNITVAFPVGSKPAYKQYLQECLDSIRAQTKKPFEVIIVDDAAGLDPEDPMFHFDAPVRSYIYKLPWRVGLVGATNICAALALTDYVYIMGSDDVLMPDALDQAEQTYNVCNREEAWYFPILDYTDPAVGPVQVKQPIMVGAIPRTYFLKTGGLIPATEAAAPDTCWHWVIEKRLPGWRYTQIGTMPTYMARWHKDAHTQTAGQWGSKLDMISMGNRAVELWTDPTHWTDNFKTPETRGLIPCKQDH